MGAKRQSAIAVCGERGVEVRLEDLLAAAVQHRDELAPEPERAANAL